MVINCKQTSKFIVFTDNLVLLLFILPFYFAKVYLFIYMLLRIAILNHFQKNWKKLNFQQINNLKTINWFWFQKRKNMVVKKLQKKWLYLCNCFFFCFFCFFFVFFVFKYYPLQNQMTFRVWEERLPSARAPCTP